MLTIFPLLVTTFSITLIINTDSVSSSDYDGYYDLSAKDTGYLCSLMDEYKNSGTQPDIITKPHNNFEKDKYLRPDDHKCWRFRWHECEKGDLKKAKPCGWYQMEEAKEKECP